jgi:hypothetical protein
MNGVPWWFLQGFGGALSGSTLQSVDPSGVIAQHIPADRVIGGVVHSSCSVDMPGVIRHHFGNGLILGEPTGADTARLRDLDCGLIEVGRAADFVFMDRAQHTAGRDLLESLQLGDLPGVGMVMIDGIVRCQRSRNTPPAVEVPVIQH